MLKDRYFNFNHLFNIADNNIDVWSPSSIPLAKALL